MDRSRLHCALSLVLLAGCGAPPTEPEPEAEATEETATTGAETEAETEAEPAPAATTTGAAAASPAPLAVRAMPRTPFEGQPSVRIVAPTEGQLVRRGHVPLRLEVRDWPLRPPPGPHVHVSVDGRREMAVSDVSRPLNLDELFEEATGDALAPGSHVLRVYLGRADHESVKRDEAFAMVVFHYRERTRGFGVDRNAPALIYGRPQGCASNGARLLDFYLHNVDLAADGHRVRYRIDDVEGDATSWVPHRITGLRPGVHSVELALVGPDGEEIDGSAYSRTFRVDPDCPTYALREYQPTEAEDDDDDEHL